MNTGTISVEFEELRLIPGYGITAYGEADIIWEYEAPDAECGYRGGYSYHIEDIHIASDDPVGAPMTVKDSGLFAMFEKALHASDWEQYIIDEIIKDRENSFCDEY